MADLFSRKNIKGFRAGVSNKFSDDFKAQINYHSFSRVETKVDYYNFKGTSVAALNNDSHLADEIDVILDYAFDENFSGQFGYASLMADDSMGKDDGFFSYLQLAMKF